MTAETKECTILFADVSGSVRLFEILGDTIARKQIATCLDKLTQITLAYGGELIKTIGDEVMCTFPDASSGVQAAKQMQESMAANISDSVPTLIRIGLHHGLVISENGDVFGDAVNIAARMADIAKANQIITTEETVLMLSPADRLNSRAFDRTPVKGKQGLVNISEIVWQAEDDMTCVGFPSFDTMQSKTNALQMTLRWQNNSQLLKDNHTSLTLGRGKQADFIVAAPLASRVHCRIDEQRGKFILTDQSLNGTYVQLANGEEVFLRRESLPLSGEGQISLGERMAVCAQPLQFYVGNPPD